MSILNSTISKIMGKTAPAAAAVAESPPPISAAQNTPSANTPSASPPPPISVVDVANVLDALKAKAAEELNWRVSIVDLMKLLSLDSSLAARKELAKELHYEGGTSDSAKMNIWLYKQVMTKLAENGGKVPNELKH